MNIKNKQLKEEIKELSIKTCGEEFSNRLIDNIETFNIGLFELIKIKQVLISLNKK